MTLSSSLYLSRSLSIGSVRNLAVRKWQWPITSEPQKTPSTKRLWEEEFITPKEGGVEWLTTGDTGGRWVGLGSDPLLCCVEPVIVRLNPFSVGLWQWRISPILIPNHLSTPVATRPRNNHYSRMRNQWRVRDGPYDLWLIRQLVFAY